MDKENNSDAPKLNKENDKEINNVEEVEKKI